MGRRADHIINRAARRVLTSHGEAASEFCEARARERLRAGDCSAFSLWCRIRLAVEVQQMTDPARGHTLN